MKTILEVKSRTPEHASIDTDAIPAYQSDAMCRTILLCVKRLFEIPEVKADYERWLKEERQKNV